MIFSEPVMMINDKIICLTLLDYSKAFDTLDRDVLYIKLKYFGYDNNALTLIKCLTSRR